MKPFTAPEYVFWAIQFLFIAAAFIRQRSNYPFASYALSRMAFDVITFGTVFVSAASYMQAFFIVKPLEYFFLFVLGMACVANAVRDNGLYARLLGIGIAFLGIVAVIAFYCLGPFEYWRMVDIEIAANMGAAIAVTVALLFGNMEKTWKVIATGYLILSAGDAILGIASHNLVGHWPAVRQCYSVLEISALAVWCFAGAQQSEARTGLGVRTPEMEKVTIQ